MKLFAKLADDFKGTEHQERTMNFLEFAKKHKVLVSKVNQYPCTPTIVIAHTFCASPDTRISYRQCLLIQGYFCAV